MEASIGLRQRKKAQTREAILTAAMELFAEHGYQAVTVAEIADRAGISRQTCFNYFAGKPAIAAAVSEIITYGIEQLVDAVLPLDVPTAERIRLLFIRAFEGFDQNRDLSHYAVLESIVTPKDLDTRRNLAKRSRIAFGKLIRAGRERGDVRTDFDEELLARICVATLSECMSAWALNREHPIEEDLAESGRFLAETVCLR